MNIYIFRIPKRPHGPSDSSFHLLHGPPRRREDQGYSSLLYPPSPLLVSLSCLTFLLFLYVYLIVIKFGTIHNRSYDHGQRHLLSCLPHPLFRFLLLPRHLWYVFIDLLMRYSSFCSHLFFQFYFNVYFCSSDRKAFFWNMQLLFIVSLGIAVFFGSVYLLLSISFLLLFYSLLFYFLFFSFLFFHCPYIQHRPSIKHRLHLRCVLRYGENCRIWYALTLSLTILFPTLHLPSFFSLSPPLSYPSILPSFFF